MSLQSVTLILAFVTGFLSLSLEIIWIRIGDEPGKDCLRLLVMY